MRLRGLGGEIDVFDWRPDRNAECIVGRDRLLGIAVERVDVERNRIVKDADAATDNRFAGIGSPLETGAGSGTSGVGDGLRLEAKAGIDRQMRIQHPVILSKRSRLQIGEVERPCSREINLLQKLPAGIVEHDRTSEKLAYILAMAEHGSELESVLAGEVKGAWRPFFDPFKAGGTAGFLAEVVALVSDRGQHHVGIALRRDAAAYHSARDCALQERAANCEAVGEGEGRLVEIGIWRHRLRIEIIESGILQCVWSEMEAGRQSVIGGDDGIELRKRIERFRGAQALVERKSADFLLVKQILDAFEKVQVIGNNGATNIEPRGSIAHTIQVAASDEEVGKRIIQTVVPLLASASRIGSDYAGSKAAVFGEVGHFRNFNRLYAVDGDAEAKAPSRGIGHIY